MSVLEQIDGLDTVGAGAVIAGALEILAERDKRDFEEAASQTFGILFEKERFAVAAELLRQTVGFSEVEIHDVVEEACRKTGRDPGAVFWAIWGETLLQRPAPRRSDAL